MRIALWHNLPSGGGKRAMTDQVRELVARGHTIEIWSPPTADRTFWSLTGVPQHILPLKVSTRSYKPKQLRIFRHYYEIIDQLDAMEEHCRACARQINQGRFDLLFVHPCQRFRSSPIGRFVKLPSVLYLQEPYRWLYEALPDPVWAASPDQRGFWLKPKLWKESAQSWLKIAALRVQMREEIANARAFKRILVNSYYSRESVLRAYGLDSHVSYLGVDSAHFKRKPVPREQMVIGIGAFVPEKNIGFIIDAVAAIPIETRPRLVWVGNVAIESYVEELQRRASEKNVELDLRRAISDEELVDLLSRAKALVYAPRLEPFGYAPLEANAAELPVVAVAEGGVRETVQDGFNGYLVAPDPQAMANAIEKLLRDHDRADRLASQGRALVEKQWSMTTATNKLARHLADVAAVEDGARE